jgi:hypothetical protein
MVSYEITINIPRLNEIPAYLRQLALSRFRDPVTHEQQNYNTFLESLVVELKEWEED